MLAPLLLALALSQPYPEEAPGIVAALTHETVEIREDYDGMELVLYGATQGLTLADEIVVVLRGPGRDLRVMQKVRNFGIWMNSAPVEFDDVPSYYAIASSRPLNEIASIEGLRRDDIGLPSLLSKAAARAVAETLELTSDEIENTPAPVDYQEAVIRTGSRDALYAEAPYGVDVLDGGLFRATIALPPRTPVGAYSAEVYLFREGRPIARRVTALTVEKAGLERIIYEFAHQASMLYGLFCVALAMLAGYLANAIFGRR
jgi:uncharacterized protein (TIGR02186 family)